MCVCVDVKDSSLCVCVGIVYKERQLLTHAHVYICKCVIVGIILCSTVITVLTCPGGYNAYKHVNKRVFMSCNRTSCSS